MPFVMKSLGFNNWPRRLNKWFLIALCTERIWYHRICIYNYWSSWFSLHIYAITYRKTRFCAVDGNRIICKSLKNFLEVTIVFVLKNIFYGTGVKIPGLLVARLYHTNSPLTALSNCLLSSVIFYHFVCVVTICLLYYEMFEHFYAHI